jgi:predicted DCC family thiol-disulfide oxidoreductase YuxK
MDQTFRPVIFFDGVCNYCDCMVNWLLRRDREGIFRFASLQSLAGQKLLAAFPDLPDSVVLVDEQGVYTRSMACLRIVRRLGMPWRLLCVFGLAPVGILDAAYGLVARNRYRWFGLREQCRLPQESERGRFLDAEELIPLPGSK